jgi:hypothetical protein
MLTTIILLVLVSGGLAKTVYHDIFTEEINRWVYNPCELEWVLVSGTWYFNIQLVIDSAGGQHWKYHAHHNLTGLSDDGTKYQIISTENINKNKEYSEPPYEWSFINTSPLISQGKKSNMLFKVRNKFIVNANGEITVSFCEVEFVCRGEKL